MPVLVPDPLPPVLDELLAHRRAIGADKRDEMWEGVLHMAPAPSRRHSRVQLALLGYLDARAEAAGLQALNIFNLGDADNYRIPDGGLVMPEGEPLYLETAALVLEVRSPNDESWDKLGFYAAHGVNEVLIVDPDTGAIDWLGLTKDGQRYEPLEHSTVIDSGPDTLRDAIDWPASA